MSAVVSVLLLSLWAAEGLAKDPAGGHLYVGSQKCAICHKEKLLGSQFFVWKAGPHARAYETLASDRAFEFAAAAGIDEEPQEARECLRCHVTGYGLPPESFARRRPNLDEGVGCESCHGPGKDYRNEKVMSDLELAKSKGLRIPGEKDCRKCHNEDSPAWDPERYELADGRRVGFDFERAAAMIAHPIPAEVKGHYLELSGKK